MRKIGIGALGLIGGALLALVVQDVLAVAFLRDATIGTAAALALGSLLPVLAVAGAVTAVLVDDRQSKCRARGRTDD